METEYTKITKIARNLADDDIDEIKKRNPYIINFDESNIFEKSKSGHLGSLVGIYKEKFKANQSKNETKKSNISNLCFVLMPFNKEFDSIYNSVIKPCVVNLGFDCKRADEIFSTKVIISDIQECIQNSKFLITDLTGRNPNVFYELGFAHALKKEVILITQSKEDVPFDVQHIRYIKYNIEDLGKLKDALIKTIQSLK